MTITFIVAGFYSTSFQLFVCLAITILVKSVSPAPVSVASSGDTGNKNSIPVANMANMAKIIAEEARELYQEVSVFQPILCGSQGSISSDRSYEMNNYHE